MALFDNDDLELGSTPRVYFLSSNLDSPVLIHEIEATITLFTAACDKKSPLRKGIPSDFLSATIALTKHNKWGKLLVSKLDYLTPAMYPDAEQSMLEGESVNSRVHYPQAKQLIKPIVEAAEIGLRMRGLNTSELSEAWASLGQEEDRKWSNAYESLSEFYGRAMARTKRTPTCWTKGRCGGVTFWINTRYALISLKGKLLASSPNQILMLKDKLAVRYMLLSNCLPLGQTPHLKITLRQLFDWQDHALRSYSNDAYSLLKAVEPMFKTRLSFCNDNVFGDDSAYPRMLEKMRGKEHALTGDTTPLIDMLHSIVQKVTDTQELVELFGSQKSCGHPIVDARRGGLSAAAEALTADRTHLCDAQNLRNTFCHIFATAYLRKHGRWPRLRFMRKGLGLELLYIAQRRSLWYHDYSLEDWNHVRFHKLFEFDYFENYLDLLDDKSISLYRDELHLSWDKSSRPSSQRRLLLEILRRDTLNLKEIIERVSRRDIPHSWMIVSLYPKEREFKLDPRMFAMMVIQMRCFFTCTEANIADNIFKYMPQQTMTKSKRQIQQRFLEFTDTKRSQRTWILFVEVDLTRWNLKWREMTVNLVGRDMNDMFGLKGVFDVCHWFFENSQIVVRVANLPPDGLGSDPLPRSELAWTGHKGGFEGICQKLWTACTYAMMEVAMRDLLQKRIISSYELIGQADNQVLRIEVEKTGHSREDTLKFVRNMVNERLETVCASVGQEVKAEENVESTSVLTYSKDVYVSGVERPTSLKKHSRLFPITSLDFPSIASNAGAIMAGAVAGAENSWHPLKSLVVGWYHTARYLLAASGGACIHGSSVPTLSHKEVQAALIIPPSLGGLVGTPIASFLYKGGSDPLGKEVSSLRVYAESSNEVGAIASQCLRAMEQKYGFSTKPDLKQLIDNPYALPLDRKISPLGSVSSRTLTAFRGKVLNKDIEPLLKASVESASNMLKDDLLTIRPLNPLLLHDLYQASIFGTVEEVKRMFLTTRTVQSVAQWTDSRITHTFLDADLRSLRDFKKWVAGLPTLRYSGRSTYHLITDARDHWGVPISGISTFHPLDWRVQSGHSGHDTAIRWSISPCVDALNTRGPLSGYLGSDTREKRSEHGYKIQETNIPARAMNKLQLIRSQAYGSDDFNHLLDKIGLTRTSTLLSSVTESLPKVIGGSWAHRYSSSLRELGASYMGPLTLATHIRLDTDSIKGISGEVDDYPWMAQQDMVYLMMVAYHSILAASTFGEMILDLSTMPKLIEDPMSCNPSNFRPGLIPTSRLAYTQTLTLASTYDSVNMRVPRGILKRVEDYSKMESLQDAFYGFMTSILRDHQAAKTLADSRGAVALPSNLQLDLAEAHAFGLVRLAESIAAAIIDSCLRDTYRTSIITPDRWNDGTFLLFSVRALVASVRQYLYHPLCRCDPRHSHLLFGSLKYSSVLSPIRSFEGLVRLKIAAVYSDLSHKYWRSPVPIFPGSSAMTIVEALTISASKYLLFNRLSGSAQSEKLDATYAAMVVLEPSVLSTPETHLRALQDKMAAFAHRMRREVGDSYSEDLQRIARLSNVVVYNDDVRTIMRYARLLPKPGESRKFTTPMSKKINLRETIVGDLTTLPLMTRYDRLWQQAELCPRGGISTLLGAWGPVITNLTPESQVIIIGVGHGHLADLVLRTFKVTVLGLDLSTDLPDTLASVLSYVPTVLDPALRHRYLQLEESISTSGDWTEEAVQLSILRRLVSPAVLIVDITPSLLPPLKRLVGLALECEMVTEVCCRYYGDRHTLEGQLSTPLVPRPTAYLVGSDYAGASLILHWRKISGILTVPSLCPKSLYSLTSNVPIPDCYSQLLCVASANLWAWEDETISEAYRILDLMAITTLNKKRHQQLAYRYRVDLIMSVLTFYAAQSESPKSLIQDWISDEQAVSHHFSLKLTQSRIEFLLRTVPRLNYWHHVQQEKH